MSELTFNCVTWSFFSSCPINLYSFPNNLRKPLEINWLAYEHIMLMQARLTREGKVSATGKFQMNTFYKSCHDLPGHSSNEGLCGLMLSLLVSWS